MSDPAPLISIFTNVKNGAQTIRRCLDSVLALNYPNFEHVIQDGASTDGTLEILRDYAARHPQVIKLVSAPDSCAEEAMFRALKRCRGTWIGSCLADEALLPEAGNWAREAFRLQPDAGAIYGDLYLTDADGRIQSEFKAPHPFSVEKYLLHEVNPPFASTFFRRRALEDIRLETHPWAYDMGEFELWIQLGLKHPVHYVPGVVATYAVHADQRSSRKDILLKLFETRCAYLPRLLAAPDLQRRFAPISAQIIGGLHLFIAEVMRDSGSYAEAADLLLKGMAHAPHAERSKQVMIGFYNQGMQLAAQKRWQNALTCWEPLEKLGIVFPEIAQIRRRLEPLADHRALWNQGVVSEIRFWEEWIGKLAQDRSITDRLDEGRPLQPTLCRLLAQASPAPAAAPLEVLDIGSGPLTSLGRTWPGHSVRITAADPLAPHYNAALDKGRIVPLSRPVEAHAEKLDAVFQESAFDLVTAINSLDHSYDPLRAIRQAVRAVKPGHFVLLANERNEGENEAYAGLHQWNFALENGDFVLWSKAGRHNVTEALKGVAEVTCEISATREFVDSEDVLVVRIRKHDTAAVPARPAAAPLVSVLVLCHNYGAHLRTAVASVLAQTFTDYELLILDDGSTDDSLQIAQALAEEHRATTSVRVLHREDVGPSAARRFGVEQARGRYFVPLDADDKLAPAFLERTVPVLEADEKLGFAYTDSCYFGDKDQDVFHPEYDFAKLCAGNFVSYCSLVRRAAFDAVDGYDRANWGYYEDWDLWIRLGQAGWQGRHVAECLFFYQQHFASSLSYYSQRLDPIYKAYVISQHPDLYAPAAVAQAESLLAEMPAGWHARPPLKAVASVQELLTRHPGNRHLLYFLALAQFRDGLAGEAVASLNALLTAHPDDQQARAALERFSVEMLRAQSPEDSRPVPSAAARPPAGPGAEALQARARELFARGQWKGAAEACAQVIVRSPNDAPILFILARALLNLGARPDAAKIARHLTALAPGHPEYAAFLGQLEGSARALPAPAGQPAAVAAPPPPARRPAHRIVALVSAYNEADVISHVIGDLIANGVEVYLLDNNSTDRTIAEAEKWLGKGLLKIERFPEDAGYAAQCGTEYVWREVLRRKEELALELGADWYLHADADEFRESPWPGKTLAEAIREVDLLGYNAINFAVYNFRPTDSAFIPGSDVRRHLTAYEPGDWFDSVQIKAWKNPGRRVDIVRSGGHSIGFAGRSVFPISFILRHYPIRSEDHGRRKVFKERLPRFNKEERAAGWHVQYNAYASGEARFLCDPAKLIAYDGNAVRADLLGRGNLDLLLASTLSNRPAASQLPESAALCSWVGRKLGLGEPLAASMGQQANQVLESLLQTQAFGEKDLPLTLDAQLAGLLLALNQVKSAYARLQGDSRLALAAHSLANQLERICAGSPQAERPPAPQPVSQAA
jgi:glycosyltransferase involved in cell wall biosynthesis/SAM-dependent methyltransferase